MYLRRRNRWHRRQMAQAIVLFVISLVCNSAQAATGNAPPHMSEALRGSISDLAVVPGVGPTTHDIAGTYDEDKPSLADGIMNGTSAGTPQVDVGPVTVSTSVPALVLPGAIAGGLFGHAKGKIQDFRDALAEDLADEDNHPLNNSRLALAVHQELRALPDVDSNLYAATAPIAEETDAVLYVSINNVVVDVRDSEAILKTTAEITLLNKSDGSRLYQKWFYYQDRDTLSNWTKNDNALWRDYTNFARHYLGREIAADVMTRVTLQHTLQPVATKTTSLKRRDNWQGASKLKAPALAWKLALPGNDTAYPWANTIDESNIFYDLEIYDTQRLVYSKTQIAEPHFELERGLEACKTFRWSVRPAYHVGNSIKYGEWMRSPSDDEQFAGKGHIGEKASKVPAYIQDFATLKIDCRAR